jgi:hypothetical protein
VEHSFLVHHLEHAEHIRSDLQCPIDREGTLSKEIGERTAFQLGLYKIEEVTLLTTPADSTVLSDIEVFEDPCLVLEPQSNRRRHVVNINHFDDDV